MLPPYAQGLMLMVLSFKCVNIPRCCFQVNVSLHLSGKGLIQSDSDTVKHKVFSVVYFCGFAEFFWANKFSRFEHNGLPSTENYTL